MRACAHAVVAVALNLLSTDSVYRWGRSGQYIRRPAGACLGCRQGYQQQPHYVRLCMYTRETWWTVVGSLGIKLVQRGIKYLQIIEVLRLSAHECLEPGLGSTPARVQLF